MQKEIEIGGIKLPVWEEGGEVWYPLNTIYKDFYNRDGLTKQSRMKYEKYCRLIPITYNYLNTSITNETWCINKEGMNIWLNNIHPKRMKNLEQKKNHNSLCEYFGVDYNIPEAEYYVKTLDVEYLNKNYTTYELKIHESSQPYNEYCLCNNCNIYYPLHTNFYLKHPANSKGFDVSKCLKCKIGNFRGEIKEIKNNIKNEYIVSKTVDCPIVCGLNDDVEYEYLSNDWYTRENIIKFFNELKDIGIINEYNFSSDFCNILYKKFKIVRNSVKKLISNSEIIMEIFGEEYYARPYNHKINGVYSEFYTFEFQKKVFDNYLNDNNIVIDDILNFDYGKYMQRAKIRFKNNGKSAVDYLDFVVKYNENKYPAYMYKTKGNTYWSIKENRISNMIALVNNMNLNNFDRLPLYLTKYTLKIMSGTMHSVLMNKYNGDLFRWIDDCYPNHFEELDFNVKILKNEFDSLEEMKIHEILKAKFGKDLIYNEGNCATRFSINGRYQPDWILLRNKPVIIEYFGMYSDNYTDKSTLVKYYNEKMPIKIDFYESLDSYDKLYIYPYDLKENFKGLYDKLKDY